MKVAVMEGIKQMSIRDMYIPPVGPEDVLVKIYQCNICTTDWQTWAGLRKSQGRKFPWAPGHEMSGEIIEIGKDVQEIRSDLKVGTHVGFGTPGTVRCGECVYCHKGHPSRCIYKPKEITIDGVTGLFGMSQYVVYKSSRVYKLSEDLPYEEGGFLEPVATSVHGVKRLRVVPGDNVLVIGAGNLGIVNAQVARAYGGRVMISEVSEERCAVAESLGFPTINPIKMDLIEETKKFTDGRGMDAVILAVGNSQANEQALQVLAPMGRILLFAAGYPPPTFNIDPNTIHYREYEIIGTFGSDPSDYDVASKFLSERIVKVDKIISHKVPLEQIQHAFELAATPGNYRVSVTMW